MKLLKGKRLKLVKACGNQERWFGELAGRLVLLTADSSVSFRWSHICTFLMGKSASVWLVGKKVTGIGWAFS